MFYTEDDKKPCIFTNNRRSGHVVSKASTSLYHESIDSKHFVSVRYRYLQPWFSASKVSASTRIPFFKVEARLSTRIPITICLHYENDNSCSVALM